MGFIFSERKEFHWDDLIGFSVPITMFFFGGHPYTIATVLKVLFNWWVILVFTGIFYNLNALSSGHHGTKIVHEGDEFKSLDFGLYQLVTTIDRIEANSNLFMTLSFFGNHTLHHLFPTIDHSLLPQLLEEFMETCKEFELQIEKITMIKGIVGNFQQLARTEIIKVE
jgi:fatty acid desaturase